MKWKTNVCLIHGENLKLKLYKKIQVIDSKDEYIALAVENGISDDNQLIALVAKQEHINETAAAFAFTQFILDYGAFIEADQSHYMIRE